MMEVSPTLVPAPSSLVPRHWRMPLLAVLSIWVWILFVFRDTAWAMVNIWMRSETFMHGFFVPPIALWLIWRQRGALLPLVPKPNPWVLLVMLPCLLLWLLGSVITANAPSQLAVMGLLVLSVPALLGWSVTRVILFPLGFLFFAVPVGEFMLEPLMEGTATFTVLALQASGIPVYREGLQFVIPSGAWSVVEACSGVRYLIASLTIGTLYAHLNYHSAKRRWLFIGVAILVPIVANWVRAYGIVLLGHLTSNRLGAGVDHLIYGWVFFGVVIMLMFVIGGRWADSAPPPLRDNALLPTGPLPAAHALLGTALAIAALCLLPHWADQRLSPNIDAAGPVLTPPVSLASPWRQMPQPPSDWVPVYRNPSSEFNAGYTDGTAEVGLYLAYYRNQHEGSKLISSVNTLTEGTGGRWARAGSAVSVLDVNGQKLEVQVSELRASSLYAASNDMRLKAWQWYWVGGRWTSSERVAKIYGALQLLRGAGDESAVVIVHAMQHDGAAADAALQAFTRANLPALEALLQQARSQ